MKERRTHEVWAVSAPDLWNTALLLFDRVWIPREFRFPFMPDEIVFSDSVLDRRLNVESTLEGGYLVDYMNYCHREGGIGKKLIEEYPATVRRSFFRVNIRNIAETYSSSGYTVVPLYDSVNAFTQQFPTGVQTAYQGALSAIPIVCPHRVSLQQVLEFRQDAEAVRKYRSLRLWVHDGLRAKSVTEATDRILSKLEAYEWSIKKHGLQTITGGLSAVLNSKTLLAITAGTGVAELVAGPVWAAIAGGLVATSRCLVWLAERRIELEDLKRGQNSEVAIFYDMKTRLPKDRA